MNNIYFSPNSMFDDFGRVFFMDNRVFRAIAPNSINDCKKLLNEPFFTELMDKGLIPKTIISDLEFADYELVLEHEKLLNTLQHEWSFSMFKNAALTILEIMEICEKYNYELKDAHTLNVLFRGGQAVYVDIGSFWKKKQDNWIAYAEFINSFFIPLSFWSEGKYYITRLLLEKNFYKMQTIPGQTLEDSELLKLLQKKNPFQYDFHILNKRLITTKSCSCFLSFVSRAVNKMASVLKGRKVMAAKYLRVIKDRDVIKKAVTDMNFPDSESLWKNYHSKFYGKDGKLASSKRFDRIIDIIKEIDSADKVNSALDLAGNEGLITFLIEERLKFKTVTLSDYDENALVKAYEKREELDSKINTVLLNFMFPPNIESVSKRLKSDIVLALAVTHHLILTSHYLLSTIFERVRSYSNKYVMIEFMPKGLWSIDNPVDVEIPDWYNEEWFKDEFQKYFDVLLVEKLEENRIMFVGKIKQIG